jgi:hypothetical protein
VVPRALRAYLYDITSELAGALRELGKLLVGGEASSARWKTGAEGERDEHDLRFLADRTILPSRGADVASRPKKLGLSVADIDA